RCRSWVRRSAAGRRRELLPFVLLRPGAAALHEPHGGRGQSGEGGEQEELLHLPALLLALGLVSHGLLLVAGRRGFRTAARADPGTGARRRNHNSTTEPRSRGTRCTPGRLRQRRRRAD